MRALTLPWLDALADELVQPSGGPRIEFAQPVGEEALVPATSVSWRVFKSPVALFVGGVAAVILELADPAVRTGVWEHSSFRADPRRRLQRTGLAAMITVYGARSRAEAMIAGVVRRHDRVEGHTPDGEAYRANDEALLTWVQATAGFGFLEAYHRYVAALGPEDRDRFYAEGAPAARLYGAHQAPASEAELTTLLESKRSRLEASPIVFEFLKIMREVPVLPPPMRPLQKLLVRAAVEMVPDWVRERLGLGHAYGLSHWQAALVRRAGALSDRLLLRSSPAVQSCRRLGLPDEYLYRPPPISSSRA